MWHDKDGIKITDEHFDIQYGNVVHHTYIT